MRGHCPGCLAKLAFGPGPEEEPTSPGPGDVIDGYELLEEIGQGAMGVVFKARQRAPNRLVALKMLGQYAAAFPGLAERLRFEAEAAGSLQHPHIVTILQSGEYEGQPFFSMELIKGPSLAKAIAKEGFGFQPVPTSNHSGRRRQKAIARLTVQIARAVDHAHKRGVLHRDLKPGNIVLDADGEPHLTDFGLAKMLSRAAALDAPLEAPVPSPGLPAGETGLTSTAGAVIGTLLYIAPELVKEGSKHASIAADIYSLGVILYEMLTGHAPFRATSQSETLRQVVEDPAVIPTLADGKVDADLAAVCVKSLNKKPEDRYDTALSLAEDLERWLRGEPVEARPLPPLQKCWRWCRRHWVLAGFLSSLFLLVTVTAVLSTASFLGKLQQVQRNALLDRMHRERATGGYIRFSSLDTALLTGRLPDPTEVPLALGLLLKGEQPELVLDNLAPLINYLHAKAATQARQHPALEARVYADQLDLARALCDGELGLVRADSATYVSARQTNSGFIPLVGEVWGRGQTGVWSAIFVRSDSPIEHLSQLKGGAHSIAFGERGTAAGDYLPKATLAAAGLRWADFQRLTNLDRSVIARVSDRSFDVGVADMEEIARFATTTNLGVRVRVLTNFFAPNPVWVTAAKMEPVLTNGIKRALLTLRDGDVLQHLSPRLTGFQPAVPSTYDALEQAMEKARLFDQPERRVPDGP
jgi:serine/threonine protein kinase/ABC-type phosphate/phosphonate transport system substrate-binding protein